MWGGRRGAGAAAVFIQCLFFIFSPLINVGAPRRNTAIRRNSLTSGFICAGRSLIKENRIRLTPNAQIGRHSALERFLCLCSGYICDVLTASLWFLFICVFHVGVCRCSSSHVACRELKLMRSLSFHSPSLLSVLQPTTVIIAFVTATIIPICPGKLVLQHLQTSSPCPSKQSAVT